MCITLPKTIQTGETITISDILLESITFSYEERFIDKLSPEAGKRLVGVIIFKYKLIKDNGRVYATKSYAREIVTSELTNMIEYLFPLGYKELSLYEAL